MPKYFQLRIKECCKLELDDCLVCLLEVCPSKASISLQARNVSSDAGI
jgi:hypothetical protein